MKNTEKICLIILIVILIKRCSEKKPMSALRRPGQTLRN